MTDLLHPKLTVLHLPLEDPRVQPLVDGLTEEYDSRYGTLFGGAGEEMRRYPAAEFSAPHGALLVLQEAGQTVAGGAFRRKDEQTAEFKRIWTHDRHRRRGLARRVLAELEEEAARRGYRRIYLTTGPRQPEAKNLYLASGYSPGFDLAADPEAIKHLVFTKDLPAALPLQHDGGLPPAEMTGAPAKNPVPGTEDRSPAGHVRVPAPGTGTATGR